LKFERQDGSLPWTLIYTPLNPPWVRGEEELFACASDFNTTLTNVRVQQGDYPLLMS